MMYLRCWCWYCRQCRGTTWHHRCTSHFPWCYHRHRHISATPSHVSTHCALTVYCRNIYP